MVRRLSVRELGHLRGRGQRRGCCSRWPAHVHLRWTRVKSSPPNHCGRLARQLPPTPRTEGLACQRQPQISQMDISGKTPSPTRPQAHACSRGQHSHQKLRRLQAPKQVSDVLAELKKVNKRKETESELRARPHTSTPKFTNLEVYSSRPARALHTHSECEQNSKPVQPLAIISESRHHSNHQGRPWAPWVTVGFAAEIHRAPGPKETFKKCLLIDFKV